MFRTSLAVLALLVGCKKEPSRLDPPSSWGSGSSGTATMPSMPTAPPPAPANQLSGTVAETMNAGGYTYARIERDGTSIWVAGPETKLAVGAKLGKMDGMAMPGFHSDTLNRTFDQIYFVNALPIEGGAAAPAAPAAPAADDELSGVVAETMDAGGYTYARIDHGGKMLWVAGPVTKLAVGSQVGKMTGSLMTSFKSDTLKRTFDQIYFVNSYNITAAAIPNPHTKPTEPTAPTEPTEKIAPATGGTTVADVFAKKDALVGKPVVVRGKVVKVNNGIMGRNWIHLRDGTGAATTNDLLVTTDATAKVGDVIVARGTVATHQDFGAGYAYDVIVEKATLADK